MLIVIRSLPKLRPMAPARFKRRAFRCEFHFRHLAIVDAAEVGRALGAEVRRLRKIKDERNGEDRDHDHQRTGDVCEE